MEFMSAAELAPERVVDEPVIRDPNEIRRRIKLGVGYGVATILLIWFWIAIDGGHVQYILDEKRLADSTIHELPSKGTTLLCAVVCLAATVLGALGLVRKGWMTVVVSLVVGVMFILGFVVWAYSDQEGDFQILITNPLPGTIRIATPLILGALAGCLCERAGVINIAIEGQFLAGAFFASAAASLAFNAYMGLVGGILAGLAIGAMLALFSIRYLVNQVVLGVVLVLFATGLTSFLLDQIPDDKKEYLNEPPRLEQIAIPGLSDIPIIGKPLFEQTALVYLMYLLVIAVTFVLFQSTWGLRVRAVGEHPTAADTVGIKVRAMRWQAVLVGGAIAGLGGAYFTVGSTGSFDKGASAGTGFIALAAVIMGRWHPIWATCAALFFGFVSNLQDQLEPIGKIPSELLGMTPYIATVIAVAGLVGNVRPPAADGEPYVKG
jgi:simple sugar transport system permease protein